MNKVYEVALSAVFGCIFLVAACTKPDGGGVTPPTCQQTTCGSACVNTAADPQNCGSCGKACGAGQTCQAGSCQCQGGSLTCTSGCITPDAQNCAGCNMPCQPGEVCNAGVCGTMCMPGTTMCGAGSCVNVMGTDPLNCGGCGTTCPSGATCTAGSCGCSGAGQMLCGAGCVDTTTSIANCGSCGHACATGQTCMGGTCSGGAGGMAGTGSGVAGTGGASAGGTTGAGGVTGTAGASGRGGTTGAGGMAGTTGTGGTAPISGTRINVNFDVDWRFNRGDVSGAEAKAFADTSWGYVDLPHTPKFVTSDDTVAYAGISAVQPLDPSGLVAGDRPRALDMTLVEALLALLAERPRVLVAGCDGTLRTGELRSVGRDVVVLRTDGDPRHVYVPVASIAEVGPAG